MKYIIKHTNYEIYRKKYQKKKTRKWFKYLAICEGKKKLAKTSENHQLTRDSQKTRDRYSEPELGNQYNPSYVDAGENYIYRSVERAIQYGVLLTALLYFFLSPHGLSLASLSESFLFLLTNDADSLVSVSLNSWPS